MKNYVMEINCFAGGYLYEERHSDSWERLFRIAEKSLSEFRRGKVYAFIGENWKPFRYSSVTFPLIRQLVYLDLPRINKIRAFKFVMEKDLKEGESDRIILAVGRKEAKEVLRKEVESKYSSLPHIIAMHASS